jgi:hypothetical protein
MELGEGGEALGLAAGERAALALEACRTLEAAAAGGATAEALALPVALARMATGTDRPRRVITGAICRGDGVAVTDHLGREVCRMPGRCSMAGALAAAAAAGWPLGAAAAATAARLQGPPDPEAVALALEARGGCPAVIATLKGVARDGPPSPRIAPGDRVRYSSEFCRQLGAATGWMPQARGVSPPVGPGSEPGPYPVGSHPAARWHPGRACQAPPIRPSEASR